MTIEEKNIEIALMLGWIYSGMTTNNLFGFNKKPSYRQGWKKKSIWNIRVYPEWFKFHSDANWQFKAINFLQKKHFNIIFAPFLDTDENTLSGEYWCQILSNNSMDINRGCVIDVTGCSSNQEAIFEALYQFSQYIKQKL
jgi:hypothetical protein